MPTDQSQRTPFYVTTPIYYVNDRPHIGHCYTTLVGDVAARLGRLLGREVFFLTGTDEHAEKVVASATQRGLTPIQWADQNAAEFRAAFGAMNFSNDDFVRTTEARHISRATAYIEKLVKSGDIALGDYEGWWDASQEEYLTETVAKEHDFKSPVTKRPLERRVEKNYFFDLPKYEERLRRAIETDEIRVLPEARKNEVLGRIRTGLQRVPVSRGIKEGDADWGIRMPGDPGHRVYVWIEALCNYLSVVDTPERRKFWPRLEGGEGRGGAEIDGKLVTAPVVHFMAKDILWFHAVIWPAMLMALGEPVPQTVYAHAYFVSEGVKMSKSLGNFIEIDQLKAYAERYSRDAVRWYLATQGPLGATDADFAYGRFVEVYNADLANGIGNCASRVANMVEKYFSGEVPDAKGMFVFRESTTEHPNANFDWSELPTTLAGGYGRRLERAELGEAMKVATRLVSDIDMFIGVTRPFTIAKNLEGEGGAANRDRLAAILYCCAEALRIASLMLYPAMPEKMAQLWKLWNCSPLVDPEDCNSAFKAPLSELAQWAHPVHGLKPGQKIAKGDALFMRADPKEPMPGKA